jgi:small GTP-binding protein
MIVNFAQLLEILHNILGRNYDFEAVQPMIGEVLSYLQELHQRVECYIAEYSDSLKLLPVGKNFPVFDEDRALEVVDVSQVLLSLITEENDSHRRIRSIRHGFYDFLVKVVVIGEGAVVKTAIVQRLIYGIFRTDFRTTIGSQFAVTSIDVEGVIVKFVIWDIAGQSRFAILRGPYYRDTSVIILVCDVGRRRTWMRASDWIGEVLSFAKPGAIVLVTNKIDLSDRVVFANDGQKLKEEIETKFGIPVLH